MIIIILVHSQRSYIETSTTWTTAHFKPGSEFSQSTDSRRYWGGSRGGISSGQRTHPIEVNVHELRQVHGVSASFKSIDETVGDDTVVSGKQDESKISDHVA